MSTANFGGMMLGTRDPVRLHDWYVAVLPPDTDTVEHQYRILRYGAFFLFLDPRDEVGERNPEPGRTLINLDVDDAREVARRAERVGTQWHAPLEDRAGSLFGTMIDPDGNHLQIIELSPAHRAAMTDRARP